MVRKNRQAGQMTVEMILIAVALLSITFFAASMMRSNNFVASLVSGPWENLNGMIQYGVWEPPKKATNLHPAQYTRHLSVKGEEN